MTPTLRISARLPSAGAVPAALGVAEPARRLEAAGFDGAWCSDHVVMTERTDRSTYPYSDDGRPAWDLDSPWFDALVVMAQAAAVTTRLVIGCAILVLPLRNAVVLAKQVASLDHLSGGRIALGVGAGWYREESEALGYDFATRGRRLDEGLDVMRRLWLGRPDAYDGVHHHLPAGVIHRPVPVGALPVLVGGMSDAALRRAARQDGWLALQRAGRLDPAALAAGVARLRAAAAEAGRDPDRLRVVLRIIESQDRTDGVARALPDLVAAGVDEVIVDTGWDGDGDEGRVARLLADARADTPAVPPPHPSTTAPEGTPR